jgi:uncharacterized protein YbbK (DUF523 family)
MTRSRHRKAIVGSRKAVSVALMNSRHTTETAPICPNCAEPLHHPRFVLRMSSQTLYSYYCEDCGEAVTEAAKSAVQDQR